MKQRKIEYKIDENSRGLKIYTFLKFKNGYSSGLIRSLKQLDDGIVLNGARAKTVDILALGDALCITLPEEKSDIEPVKGEIDIIYEDDDVLVINKDGFTAMHPTHNHQGDTLANRVIYHLTENGACPAFKAIGRLDKGTSGLVVLALNALSACKLSGKIEKTYVALVKGQTEPCGTVDVPIYRPDALKTLRACSYEKGTEKAVTHYKTLERFADSSKIELRLETGRTHQIRVHMAHIGHPLAGDSFYGDFRLEEGHQLLHCKRCEFIHPVTNEQMIFEVKENF